MDFPTVANIVAFISTELSSYLRVHILSIFGMIYAKTTKLILDLEVWDAEITGFHPNINTATLEISHPNLARFFESLPCEKEIVALM